MKRPQIFSHLDFCHSTRNRATHDSFSTATIATRANRIHAKRFCVITMIIKPCAFFAIRTSGPSAPKIGQAARLYCTLNNPVGTFRCVLVRSDSPPSRHVRHSSCVLYFARDAVRFAAAIHLSVTHLDTDLLLVLAAILIVFNSCEYNRIERTASCLVCICFLAMSGGYCNLSISAILRLWISVDFVYCTLAQYL